MKKRDSFINEINRGYKFEGSSIILGGAMLNKECIEDTFVRLPLETMNRHGLIAGATGTGKTITLQIIAEQLSALGVPSLLMDVKGDLSGIAAKSDGHPKIDERHDKIGLPFIAGSSPIEFLTISNEPGVRLRATVTEFGPILFSKILNLNDTQQSIVSIIYKYCDDMGLPLLDLKDFKKTLQYLSTEGKQEIESTYGRVSTVSMSTILRKIIELEQQGGEMFFGERSFEVDELLRLDDEGKGMISILRVPDIQHRPKLFSTFMLQLLAEIYANFPEEGDLDKPKLVMFIDEAHLIFKEASDTLMDQLEIIIKLIRSKGVGLIFVTQNPADIPNEILGQLGIKVQHALRSFTAKDRKAIKLASENYPLTDYYDIDQIITELGIGEALVTSLNEKGIPTPLVHTLLRAPQSRMGILKPSELKHLLSQSDIKDIYNEEIDRESAFEILNEKLDIAADAEVKAEREDQWGKARKVGHPRKEKSMFDQIFNSPTTRQIGRTVARELTRGLLGVLGVSTSRRRRRRRKKSWF